MIVYYVVAGILSLFYLYIISKYAFFWKKLREWHIPVDFEPSTFISVIIPARNEAENIQTCLDSVLKQSYPADLFEIIVVDDHSEDTTAETVKHLDNAQVKLIQLSKLGESYTSKKRAITTGIENASGELIVTTDADCMVKPDWLKLIASFYESKEVKFIAAPVNFYGERGLFEKFQSLDFLGMMGVTGAGIRGQFMNMCNGANLAYEKSVFTELGGFTGIDHLASGDDMLLMQKIAKYYPGKIGFLKNREAVVLTKAQPDLSAFINQRIRWASKSASYEEWQVTFILAMVFLFCVSILLSVALIPFFGWMMFVVFMIQFLLKTLMDYIFLGKMATFFKRKDLMKIFLPAQLFHIVYIAGIGFLAQFVKKYTWKGRQTR